jgi:hypothetical protein
MTGESMAVICHSDVHQSTLPPQTLIPKHTGWLTDQLFGFRKDGHAAAGLRPTPLVALLVAALVCLSDIHAHDSYPCAAQEDTHEASGSNHRKSSRPSSARAYFTRARPAREERSASSSTPKVCEIPCTLDLHRAPCVLCALTRVLNLPSLPSL